MADTCTLCRVSNIGQWMSPQENKQEKRALLGAWRGLLVKGDHNAVIPPAAEGVARVSPCFGV